MGKFSVKKPLTVFVVVILIMVLGVVSFTKMTPDLFPNIDMPYVIVMTTYPGATPEKVEDTVTKPLEQSLSTLEDIKTVQSVSDANYSMVVLEFENSINMDTVSVDILSKANLVEGGWDDTVGTPTILKLNPSMIPVSVMAVDYEGKDQTEISTFVEDTLLGKLEGTSGVASIGTGGILEEKVNVVISQKKIDKLNNKVLASINSGIASAQNEIREQKSSLRKSLSELNAQEEELDEGAAYMPEESYNQAKDQIAIGRTQINEGLEQIGDAEAEINAQAAEARKAANVGEAITVDMVSGILQAQNFSMPAGYIEASGTRYLVSVGDVLKTKKAAKNLYLFNIEAAGIGDVTLEDVADIFVSDNADSIFATINGNDGVVLSYSKQSNYSTTEVSDNIMAKCDELSAEYDGLTFTSLMDQGDYIHLVIKSILESLLWGALFAILILLLFLRDIRPTIITLCSIPISLLFAIVLMYFSGITINLISLSGLAVAVGMLVDNSVVVIENITRIRRQGYSPAKAAVAGAKQVAGAVTASTLTTVCVFVPIIFTDGITRQLFTDMALTVAYSLVASLIISLTLVPAMSSKMLVNIKPQNGKFFAKVLSGYQKSLWRVLAHKGLTIFVALMLLGGSVVLALDKGFTFMPDMSSPQLSVNIEMPEGSKLNETKAETLEVIKRVQWVDEVENVGAILASDGTMFASGSSNSASAQQVTMYVMLSEDMKRTSGQIAEEINKLCDNMDCTVEASGSSMGDFTSALGGEGISIKVYGTELDTLQKTAKEIGKELEGVAGIEEVNNGLQEADPEIRFVVNKTKAMKKGVTVAQIYSAIVKEMNTETEATSVTWKGEDFDVIVSSDQKEALTPKKMKNLTVTVQNNQGQDVSIKLSDIAKIEETETLDSINRENQSRYITITGTIAEGYNVTKVTAAAEDALADYDLGEDVSMEFAGENETIMDAMEDLMLMMLLAIVFVYMIMVAQFQSLKSPFIIMFTIPLAITGGLLALLITGKEISVIAMVGFIMLIGVIVNNGIVLVDYINQLRGYGKAKKEAIVQAGMTRMRPILMTSLTTILGLVVMALGKTAGTDMMQPIAIVCIGGLLYATFLTLYIVPVIYDLMNKEEYHQLTDEDLDIRGIE
ncbi:MAG TPA: efflux RND transporter permease subunit [Anaerovoracaceae bacterium]|nr:efflux RND transporter permease subunit [Anaerovoracaceae bacterium]